MNPPSPPRRVLVVEDHDDIRELLTMFLESLGHTVTAVADGASALVAARREAPDVALVDLGLPDMDGHEVARRVRSEHGSGLRLVALTGAPNGAGDRETSCFDAYFTKPLRPEDLEHLV